MSASTIDDVDARRRQLVEQAARDWRRSLIDVSRNNPLLYHKADSTESKALSLDGASPQHLARLLRGDEVTSNGLFVDRADAAGKALKKLAAKQKESQEEYGVPVAFHVSGFATWSPDAAMPTVDEETDGAPDVEAGAKRPAVRGGRPVSAPVLLRPLTITVHPGRNDVELALSPDVQLNSVLLYVLRDMGVEVDEEALLTAAEEGGDGAVLAALTSASGAVPGFAIAERQLLGAFTYSNQAMVADCEDVDALAASDVVAALAGDAGAIGALRSHAGDVHERDPDYAPVEAEHLVLDADASQSYVVNAALKEHNLVVQGPPGTGKSQTIANVIASCIAEGRTVLFVAQKRAAIQAVLSRLDAVGLDELTLDLFAAGSSRRWVHEQLDAVLEAQHSVGKPMTAALHRELGDTRDRLVRHTDAMHRDDRAWGTSVVTAIAELSGLPEEVRTAVRLPATTLARWKGTDLEAHATELDELVDLGGLARADAPGWSRQWLTTPDRVEHVNQLLIRLRFELLPAAVQDIDAVRGEVGAERPTSVLDAAGLLEQLDEAAVAHGAAPEALTTSLDDTTLRQMLAATDKAYRKREGVELGWGERRRLKKQARQLVTASTSSDADVHAALARADRARQRWTARRLSAPVRPLSTVPVAQGSVRALADALHDLSAAVQGLELQTLSFDALDAVLADLDADRRRASMPRLHALERRLTDAGCGHLLGALRADAANAVVRPAGDTLRHAALSSVVETALTSDPTLAGVTGRSLSASSALFADRDVEHLSANAARVRRAAAQRLAETLDANPDEHRSLKRDLTRKRQIVPVRRLFTRSGRTITAIKPVWAMSPLQVSRLLPARHCFDLVIFDEASQVKPADAVPALTRAPKVLIAGDSNQLPPTAFFSKTLASDDDEPDETVDLDEAPDAQPSTPRRQEGSYTKDAESVLVAFDRVLAGQARRLRWHYRSRDERLIAASNHHVYAGSMTTFPAADGEGCLEHIVVPPSRGIGTTTNSPVDEVQKVVDMVVDHVRARPDESLGVITFGKAHADRIEAALDARARDDEALAQYLQAEEGDTFFVKNIERVQGDERDAIILSVGYGKTPGEKLKLFWGPILSDGGERRLNVAISRARRRMTLVTSFAVEDVAEDAHSSRGFQLMYQFLRYMASGGEELSSGSHGDVPLNPFEIDVRDRLTAAGLDLVPQLGVGSYRLDFAVRHPERPGQYVLAVEADGAMYHSGHVARERDRLRQRLLEGRGWTFHRIWSTDWFNDADGEVAKVVASYERALAASARADAEPAAPTPTLAGKPTWHMAERRRTVSRPALSAGVPIDKHPISKLVDLVRHVRSDGVIRTKDEELAVLIEELGYSRRGSKIVAALTEAQRQA